MPTSFGSGETLRNGHGKSLPRLMTWISWSCSLMGTTGNVFPGGWRISTVVGLPISGNACCEIPGEFLLQFVIPEVLLGMSKKHFEAVARVLASQCTINYDPLASGREHR